MDEKTLRTLVEAAAVKRARIVASGDSLTGYDIIGDIHGQYDKLEGLLRHLGYRETLGAWRCAGRQAIFVGDLIDRGPAQLRTVDTVRRMVEAGSALCIMGNHEFNAIAWTVPDPERPGEYLRPHDKPSNRHQHAAFLAEVEGRPEHREIIDWFRTLPLWLDLGEIRVVHACWHESSLTHLSDRLQTGTPLHDDLVLTASRRGHRDFAAVEAVCKGLEVQLPEGLSFLDKGGTRRHEARIRWWASELRTYRQAAIGPTDLVERVPDHPLPPALQLPAYAGPPVFFGHYWFTGQPQVLSPRLACLDYSAARDGPLVAYRWDGESDLASGRLHWTGS